jgi:protein-S-isoprenylcysteine O-methyltransferase Ste14
VEREDLVLAFIGMPALTLLVYYLWICAEFHQGNVVLPSAADLARISPPTLESVGIFGFWLVFQAVLQVIVPGRWQEGPPLANGSRLRYRLNGWNSFCFSIGLFFLAVTQGWMPRNVLYEQFGPLLTTANLFAYIFSLILYSAGRLSSQTGPAAGGCFSHYFLGVSLNPRIGRFDLKFFLESRPGLIGWVLIDLSLAAEQAQRNDNVLTIPMLLVVGFQFFYVADYFWHEEAILSTWDIKREKLGWMLVWGNLVWVPFIFTLQAHYLMSHTHDLPWSASAGIIVLNVAGYAMFRGANWQKHRFRQNPDAPIWGQHPDYIRTQYGTLLLASGWWGIARHMNYLGDLMMALAWCLPCLFESPLPYFYFVYFVILLVHRERRDHQACREKYGRDWDEYCRRVRWRILPYVY